MVLSATDSSGPRRPRTERGKRSKNGCRTCLTKKVKCDERRPVCFRCTRLNLSCEWPVARPSLTQRRRGYGPMKDRPCWTPRTIRPKHMDGSVAAIEAHAGRNILGHPSGVADIGQVSNQCQGLHSGNQDTQTTTVQSSKTIEICSSSEGSGSDSYQRVLQTSLQQNDHNNDDSFTDEDPSVLSEHGLTNNIIGVMQCTSLLWNWEVLERKDMQALSFHRAVFAPLKSTQDASRSAHSVFLHRAFDREMALHFLLAVSHNELAIYTKHQIITPPETRLHYRRGSELLQKQVDMRNTESTDHLNMMLSFLYIYLFWMRRNHIDPQKIHQISRTIFNYVQLYTLDTICSLGALLPPITNLPELARSVSDQILLARILIYLYDRDGLCCFFGCGGALANYVGSMPDKRQALWQISRIPFLWPMDGITSMLHPNMESEHKYILDVYFELIVVHQEINCLSQSKAPDPCGFETKLRQQLEDLGKSAPFLSSLVGDGSHTVPAPLMAYVTTTVFYALQIYLNRSSTSSFGGTPMPRGTQQALTALLAVAYKTIAVGRVQLLERFQWALLIAGIETSDPIHREWVQTNIADPGVKNLLQVILARKSQLGGAISMATIRQLLER
ncbi:hypothetical protein BDV59DRAFT_53918 [Aspergillus ambiguus]|uniref:Zn(II)2Cys6 transcription factor domain-containing protein n=1 Tax=Aspergillus ambiguus TaxID=176160 RepID=UPI003CCD88C3